ncbi:hypothetical protein HK096_007540 [Nowakowskiella sp. JEL0078]|nr:hypothetical protein HK096_007540 [Nowakowskiella sp. JEL0078]
MVSNGNFFQVPFQPPPVHNEFAGPNMKWKPPSQVPWPTFSGKNEEYKQFRMSLIHLMRFAECIHVLDGSVTGEMYNRLPIPERFLYDKKVSFVRLVLTNALSKSKLVPSELWTDNLHPSDVWQNLEKFYFEASEGLLIDIDDQFSTATIQKKESFMEFYNCLIELNNQLGRVDVKRSDLIFIGRYAVGISKIYPNEAFQVESINSLPVLRNRLARWDAKRHLKTPSISEPTNNPISPSQSLGAALNITAPKPGHTIFECEIFKKDGCSQC